MVNKFPRYLRWSLFVVIALMVLAAVMWRTHPPLGRHFATFAAERARLEHILQTKGTVTIDDVGSLQSWMTFEYINRLFSLPPEYLQKELTITDTKYPRLTLSRYAKKEHLEKTELLHRTQTLIRDYLTK